MQKTQVQSLGQEDHLEKEMATHSSILDWEIPCLAKAHGGAQWATVHGFTKSQTPLSTHTHAYTKEIFVESML